ncbi:MAG: hypothetical protein BWX63_00147 [Bacteroidetes bacterium ADurb.Bin041]|nr:MAG: hypothetical protein BWX63_00147 [Bacteroidetes bacterium ADurb.Bin041]
MSFINKQYFMLEKEKDRQKLIYRYAAIVFLVLLIIIGVLYIIKTAKIRELNAEKEQIRIDLQSELDSLMLQHNHIKKEYGILTDSLVVKDSLIQANAKEITELLNYKWEYYQIKKKLDRLRVVAQGYVYQLDSLYTVNKELQEENERIRENYQTERQKNIGLTKEKHELINKVTEAAVMKAYNIKSTGLRYRGARQEETDRARRTDAVRICFTIGENSLITPGKKDIYLRIARPDNFILIYDDTDYYTFFHEGNKLQYSLKHTIDFTGKAQNVCVVWNKHNQDEKTMAGIYHVMVYDEENLIGETSFELK